MKKLFLIFLFPLLLLTSLQAQNLVPNPSFEDYYLISSPICDTDVACSDWYSPTDGSPDYFSTHSICIDTVGGYCNTDGIPQNFIGYQYPRTGNAYWGLGVKCICGSDTTPSCVNYREYIQAKLLDSLRKGVKYCVSFYISLADSAAYASDGIAAYFSDNAVSHFGTTEMYFDTLNYIPQVHNPHGNIITDKQNWTLISGSFIANGGEQYITIGNFWDDANTETMWVAGGMKKGTTPFSYFYIDDVSVSIVSEEESCASTAINKINNKDLIIIFPNPATSEIQVIGNQLTVNGIDIFDMLGERVYSAPLTDNRSPIIINISAIPPGMYFLQIKTQSGVGVRKFIKE
jgi:hypothetical protein